MMETLPAISMAAVPGRRSQTIELASEIERRGFTGIYFFALHPYDYATTASFIREVSRGLLTRYLYGALFSRVCSVSGTAVAPCCGWRTRR